MNIKNSVTEEEYRALAEFRYGLRKFLRFSEAAARKHGITPQQHQLLLAIKGFPGRDYATVSELAERLQLMQHSVVGIIDRSEQANLVYRRTHAEDLRVTEVHLTPLGEEVLEALTVAHRDELKRSREFLASLNKVLGEMDPLFHPVEEDE
ncbi:MarR family winged helix-turn-helix transcriptional regulator [Sulfobacillus harzensis]|uniref:MarR family transcriptional regulator n=1 Tax=Sulfobacillus harzensis TaxID=2729629 RepID=A0A7Y0L774_9FIRM|nr:MarR family transcriptional regulator [Sulfobacillus harzensis]NMP24578.1 MarR family transcriptional regulator [Sulfobacillus harzensis]